MRHLKLASFLGISSLMVSSPSLAGPHPGSWPTYAHDFSHTGRADGVGALKKPTIAWTLQLGGGLTTDQALVSDLAGSGQPDVLTISGGRVIAAHPDGTTMWKGGLVGAQTLLGVWDLDGVPPSEVVVDTLSGVIVLRATDGQLLATLPTNATVRGTFVPAAKGGILVLAAPHGPVTGFDFRAGDNVTQPLWTLAGDNQAFCAASDIDGDGTQDLVRPLNAGFEIDDPLTGLSKYSVPAMSPTAYFYEYAIANVDGKPGNEIIAVDTSYIYSPQAGIYVVGVRGGALATLWSSAVPATATLTTQFFTVAGSTTDLDGDGLFETVYSQWDGAAQTWTTRIADAATGASLGTIPGQIVEAVGDIDGSGKEAIVVRSAVGVSPPQHSTLGAFNFASRLAGPVAKSWTLPSAHVMTTSDQQHAGPWADIRVPVVADFDPAVGGMEFLVGQDPTNSGQDTQLVVVHGADGSIAATSQVSATVTPTIIDWANGLTKSGSTNDIVTYGNDGVVHVRAGSLASSMTLPAGTYSNWMSALTNSSGMANLFAATSNDHLQWIDGRQLHANGQPYVRFDEPGVVDTSSNSVVGAPQDPVVVLDGPASTTLVSFEQGPSLVSVVGHDPSGAKLWQNSLSAATFVVSPGALAADLNNDGQADLILAVENTAQATTIITFDGTNGHLLGSTALQDIAPGGDGLGIATLTDVNGDGRPDLVTPVHGAGLAAIDLSKTPFAQLWLVTPASAVDGTMGVASLVSAATADAGASTDLFRVNGADGFGPYERLSLAGVVVASADQGLPLEQGFDENTVALVSRGQTGAFDLVSAGTAATGLSRVERLAGDTISTVWTVYLANGSVSATVPAAPSALHDPLELDVDGNGTEDIVIGSDDGYIYALSSIDGSLVFSVNMGAPVQHLIAANIDQDPALELIASLADGRMVALDDNYVATKDGPDGGVVDSGAPDAGPGSGADASIEAGTGASGGAGGGGCGCRAIGGSGSGGALALAASLFAMFARRRRRSAKSAAGASDCRK